MPCHTLKNTTCCHPLQVFQAQAGEAQRAHPLLGQLQVEPAQVEGHLPGQVGGCCGCCRCGRRNGCLHARCCCSAAACSHATPAAPACLQDRQGMLLDRHPPDAVGARGVRSKPGCVDVPCPGGCCSLLLPAPSAWDTQNLVGSESAAGCQLSLAGGR